MFRLAHPEALWWLLAIPVALALFVYYWRRRRRALDTFARREVLDYLAPGLNRRLPWTKFGLLLASLPFLAVALANPQWSAQREEIQRRGIDLIVALDVSNSMLAEDVQPSRMERAQYFAATLVDELAGNNIGVALFTCTAVLQAPMTTDYAFVKSVISSAGPYQIPAQGTNLGEAINLAERSFTEESANHRALIIISDGEDHDGSAAAAAATAYESGLLIYTVGVGKQNGSLMPMLLDNGRRDYVRMPDGGAATTSADPATLEAIAGAGGGSYFPLSADSEGLAAALRRQVDRIEKQEFETQEFSSYDSYFYWFLAVAVLLLGVELLMGERGRGKALFFLLLFSVFYPFPCVTAQSAHRSLRKGNEAYREKDFSRAEAEYNSALDKENSARGNYNLGNALYEKGDFEGAGKRYEEAATLSDDVTVQSRAYRNLGDSYYQRQDYEKAVESYKQSLRLAPDDRETKYNLTKALKSIQQQQQQQQQQQNQNQDQQNQDNQQQDQPQQGQGQGQQNDQQQPQSGDQEQQQENGQEGRQDRPEDGQQGPQDSQGQRHANPDQPTMSREEAERQLGIASDAEKETMRRLQKGQQSGCRSDKEW